MWAMLSPPKALIMFCSVVCLMAFSFFASRRDQSLTSSTGYQLLIPISTRFEISRAGGAHREAPSRFLRES